MSYHNEGGFLLETAKGGYLKVVQYLVEKVYININKKKTALGLVLALEEGHSKIVQYSSIFFKYRWIKYDLN